MNKIKHDKQGHPWQEKSSANASSWCALLAVIRIARNIRRSTSQRNDIVGTLHWNLIVIPRVMVRALVVQPIRIKAISRWAKLRQRSAIVGYRLQRRFLYRPVTLPLNEALVRAACRGEEHNVECLLQRGAAADQKLDRTIHLLPYLADRHQIGIVRLLLEAGANTEVRQWHTGDTALLRAVRRNDLEMARLLLSHGAKVEARGFIGLTPLVYTARYGSLEVARLLLEYRADPDSITCGGRNAEDYAAKFRQTEILDLFATHRKSALCSNNSVTSTTVRPFQLGLRVIVFCTFSAWCYVHFSRNSSPWFCLVLGTLSTCSAWVNFVRMNEQKTHQVNRIRSTKGRKEERSNQPPNFPLA